MRNELRTKHATFCAAALGLAIFGALCATAMVQQPLNATYVMTYVEKDRAYNIWSGTGSGTVVGNSSQLVAVKVMGKKGVAVHTITASNGDSLVIASSQTWNAATQTWVGTFTITGGTGGFANASGGGTETTSTNPDGTANDTLNGTISF